MVQEEGWVVCRVFKKRVATVQRMADSSRCWFVDDHVAGFMPALSSPRQLVHHRHPNAVYEGHQQQLYHCKPELEYHHLLPSQEAFLPQLPQLESPRPPAYVGHGSGCSLQSSDEPFRYAGQQQTTMETAYMAAVDDSATDWRVLDKFVASQLFSHGDGTSKEPSYSNSVPVFQLAESNKRDETLDYASTSASGGDEGDLWK